MFVGKKIQILSSSHLRCDRFKQNLKFNNFIKSILEALSDNVERNISSSLINLCHYIDEYYEDEFVSAAGDSCLTFSGSISTIETASMMNNVDNNISQLRILHRILRHHIGVKLFEPQYKMIGVCGEMIIPQFGEYKYIHEIDVIIGGDHGQGTFRFLMKLLFVMTSSKIVERESSVVYVLCRKNNDESFKNTIVDKLQNSFKLILKSNIN